MQDGHFFQQLTPLLDTADFQVLEHLISLFQLLS
ncbi:hypothetical protein L195_g063609, partial [Trifolium pratense]